MDNEPTVLRVPSPPRRGSSALVVVGAIVVALAVLKPWALGAPGRAGGGEPVGLASQESRPPAAPGTAASATPVASGIWDPNVMACMSSEGNRLLALVRDPGEEVRTWLTIDDLSRTDPLDPAIVPLRLPTSGVVGLGICAQRLDQASVVSSAAEILDVRLVASDGASVRDLGRPPLVTAQLGDPTLGILYGPPGGLGPLDSAGPILPARSAGPSTETTWPAWPVGSYALGFRFPLEARTALRWVRLDIVPSVGRYG